MKYRTVLWNALLGLALSAGSTRADIRGSAHDFSTQAWSAGQVCLVCHAPHNSQSTLVPLWNRRTTQATFTMYGSPTFSAAPGQPGGASKACLSCHDGTVALDNFGGFVGGKNTAGLVLGTDLRGSHPISFTYDSTLSTKDHGLYDPTTQNSGVGSTIHIDLLHEGKVECTSCHNVHNESGTDFLLVKSNAGSALCLTCHNK